MAWYRLLLLDKQEKKREKKEEKNTQDGEGGEGGQGEGQGEETTEGGPPDTQGEGGEEGEGEGGEGGGGGRPFSLRYTNNLSLVRRANECFRSFFKSDTNDADSLCFYALFLALVGETNQVYIYIYIYISIYLEGGGREGEEGDG